MPKKSPSTVGQKKPIKVSMDFDEAMKRVVKVKPEPDQKGEDSKQKKHS